MKITDPRILAHLPAHQISSLITTRLGTTVHSHGGNVVSVHGSGITTLGILVQDKNTTKVVFSKRLASLMTASGVTQVELAQRIGVTQTTVWKWRKGSVPDGISTVKIAEFFGVSEASLFTADSHDTTLGVDSGAPKTAGNSEGSGGSNRHGVPICLSEHPSKKTFGKPENLHVAKTKEYELLEIAEDLKSIIGRINRIANRQK